MGAKGAEGAQGSTGLLSAYAGEFIGGANRTVVAAPATVMQQYDLNSFASLNTSESETSPSVPQITIQRSFLMPNTSVTLEEASATIDRGDNVAEYVVSEGDTLSAIAYDYGISTKTLIWANNLVNPDRLRLGTKLKIPPINGVLHNVKKGDTVSELANIYGAETERIIAFNGLPLAGDLRVGDEIIIPDGVITKSSGASTSVTVKRFSYLPDLNSYYLLPVGQGKISRGGSSKGLHGRNGIDRVVSCGTSVYAAAAGQITSARTSGWNNGAGKMILIDHPNGTSTLYAHLSSVLVQYGQDVSKGDKIALSGTTGNSTGCHLHFEVRGARNPYATY